MAEREFSFEEVDRQIQSLKLTEEKKVAGKAAAASPADVISQVCPIYQAIRPILKSLLSLPIPKKWKDAIRSFIRLMDLVCPA
jgi:hypothetical protein